MRGECPRISCRQYLRLGVTSHGASVIDSQSDHGALFLPGPIEGGAQPALKMTEMVPWWRLDASMTDLRILVLIFIVEPHTCDGG